MKIIAIGACIGAMVTRAFEIDSEIDTYGTLSASYAKPSLNNYKTQFAELGDTTGTTVGELLL